MSKSKPFSFFSRLFGTKPSTLRGSPGENSVTMKLGYSRSYEPSGAHYILKTPMVGDFQSLGLEEVVFATGCFWGAEVGFWKFPGVYTTAVVYAGGTTENPTYEGVCSGKSGHTEGVYVVFDPKKISFADIFRQFLQCHDPTQKNKQGNDSGTQYRGAFYYTTEEQKAIGLAAIKKYEEQLGKKIHTEIRQLDDSCRMYYAEEYHQQYLAKPGSRPYCSAMPTGVNLAPYKDWMPADLQSTYMPRLGEDFWKLHAPAPHCVLRLAKTPIEWPSKS